MRGPLRTYGSALKYSLTHTSFRQVTHRPLQAQAEALIGELPAVDLSEVTGPFSFTATFAATGRHDWSLHASDQLVLQAIVAARKVKTAFEIGTFNGGTTRVLAEAIGNDAEVWTLDLPPADYDAIVASAGVTAPDVGHMFRDSPVASRITQIRQDSASFDPSPYEGRCDLVLVDGAHDYEHGWTDTKTAFRLVAPDGLILWDDFQPFWDGLIRGIFDAAGERRPRRLAGSNLGVWCSDMADCRESAAAPEG